MVARDMRAVAVLPEEDKYEANGLVGQLNSNPLVGIKTSSSSWPVATWHVDDVQDDDAQENHLSQRSLIGPIVPSPVTALLDDAEVQPCELVYRGVGREVPVRDAAGEQVVDGGFDVLVLAHRFVQT